MVRTQIQLEEAQLAVLRKLAMARKQSIAQLIRRSVDLLVQQENGATEAARIERAKRAAGRFASASADGSRRHDHYLADAFAAGK
jgi:predicted DNA-binding ribbon-helix-helix protein